MAKHIAKATAIADPTFSDICGTLEGLKLQEHVDIETDHDMGMDLDLAPYEDELKDKFEPTPLHDFSDAVIEESYTKEQQEVEKRKVAQLPEFDWPFNLSLLNISDHEDGTQVGDKDAMQSSTSEQEGPPDGSAGSIPFELLSHRGLANRLNLAYPTCSFDGCLSLIKSISVGVPNSDNHNLLFAAWLEAIPYFRCHPTLTYVQIGVVRGIEGDLEKVEEAEKGTRYKAKKRRSRKRGRMNKRG